MIQKSLFGKPKPKVVVNKPIEQCMNPPTQTGDGNDRFTQPFLDKMKLVNTEDIQVYETIQRYRLQMLIWSKMYYDFNDHIVSDKVWGEVAQSLKIIQQNYPEISKIVAYAEEFKDWDASTGFDLPLNDPWVVWKANMLLHKK